MTSKQIKVPEIAENYWKLPEIAGGYDVEYSVDCNVDSIAVVVSSTVVALVGVVVGSSVVEFDLSEDVKIKQFNVARFISFTD